MPHICVYLKANLTRNPQGLHRKKSQTENSAHNYMQTDNSTLQSVQDSWLMQGRLDNTFCSSFV